MCMCGFVCGFRAGDTALRFLEVACNASSPTDPVPLLILSDPASDRWLIAVPSVDAITRAPLLLTVRDDVSMATALTHVALDGPVMAMATIPTRIDGSVWVLSAQDTHVLRVDATSGEIVSTVNVSQLCPGAIIAVELGLQTTSFVTCTSRDTGVGSPVCTPTDGLIVPVSMDPQHPGRVALVGIEVGTATGAATPRVAWIGPTASRGYRSNPPVPLAVAGASPLLVWSTGLALIALQWS
jgi:hypothetical protein